MEHKILKLLYYKMESFNQGGNRSIVYFHDDDNNVYTWEVHGIIQAFIDFASKDFSKFIRIESNINKNNELLNVSVL